MSSCAGLQCLLPQNLWNLHYIFSLSTSYSQQPVQQHFSIKFTCICTCNYAHIVSLTFFKDTWTSLVLCCNVQEPGSWSWFTLKYDFKQFTSMQWTGGIKTPCKIKKIVTILKNNFPHLAKIHNHFLEEIKPKLFMYTTKYTKSLLFFAHHSIYLYLDCVHVCLHALVFS